MAGANDREEGRAEQSAYVNGYEHGRGDEDGRGGGGGLRWSMLERYALQTVAQHLFHVRDRARIRLHVDVYSDLQVHVTLHLPSDSEVVRHGA